MPDGRRARCDCPFGASFGLLFHVYPYFWTAAFVALTLALLIDRGHREVYFWTALIGCAIGSYRIYWDVMLKRTTPADWLVRSDKLVPVSRLYDLKPPLVATLVLALGFVWIWRHRRDLIYLWTMALSGYLLFKHHVVTGRELENYHWIYVWAPCCSLLMLLMLVSVLPKRGPRARIAFAVLMAVSLIDVAIGFALRTGESLHANGSLSLVRNWADYQAQRLDSGARRFIPNATVGGDQDFVDCAAVLENQRPLSNYWVFLSPQVTDAEWYQRIALNAPSGGQGPRVVPG